MIENLKTLIFCEIEKEYKSIYEFCKLHNISEQTLYSLKNSDRSPKLETVIEICKPLGISLDQIFQIQKEELEMSEEVENKIAEYKKEIEEKNKMINKLKEDMWNMSVDLINTQKMLIQKK